MPKWEFPKDFLWGCATASYQVEGAVDEDGRGRSIWDTFCEKEGAIKNGETGRVACDHYHRYEEDIAIMKSLGIRAYRFSIAWPRILPEGTGPVNEKGVEFYDRLVDSLLEAGIKPVPTLYHWDLPQVLEDRGGWRVRETVDAFENYARVVASRLGDRVRTWCTLNEPWVVWYLGYREGTHAPGAKETEKTWRQISHHLLLAHGAGMRGIRQASPLEPSVGIVHSCETVIPFFEGEEEIAMARDLFKRRNAWLTEPIFEGKYPEEEWNSLGTDAPEVLDGDMELISQPCDFVGLNIYSAPDSAVEGLGPRRVEERYPRTDISWPIVPDCLYWAIRFANDLWKPHQIFITENGCCFLDEPNEEGRVEDYARVHYLRHHLRGVHRAVDEGYPLAGYFLWSLMDNFEWAEGYEKRFGIVYVDYATLQRIPKMSASWYSKLIAANGL